MTLAEMRLLAHIIYSREFYCLIGVFCPNTLRFDRDFSDNAGKLTHFKS